MRRETTLHPEFAALTGKVNYVQEAIHGHEWSSSCPECGGIPHQNGEWPNRFRMWPVGSGKHSIPVGWCRMCGYRWTPAKEYHVSQEQRDEWEKQRREATARHNQAILKVQQQVAHEKRWLLYNRQLQKDAVAQWHWLQAGIPLTWANYWKLGTDLIHRFGYINGNSMWQDHHTRTLTIPVVDLTGKIVNIMHRMLVPTPRDERYRLEYRAGIEPIFMANKKLGNNAETAFLCEGAKKAMVFFITLADRHVQVYGLAKSPSFELLEAISASWIIYIGDPDVFLPLQNGNGKITQAPTINRIMGTYARRYLTVVKLPAKVDDMILAKQLDATWAQDLFTTKPARAGKVNLIERM